jgi:hypothetical protein
MRIDKDELFDEIAYVNIYADTQTDRLVIW